jgi:hypothetical protein
MTMSASEVYQQVMRFVRANLDARVDESSTHRLGLYVSGLICGQNARPAQVAKALDTLKLTGATKAESLERQVRRMENDVEVNAEYCFRPLARSYLAMGHPQQLVLILDPTLQEDKLVMVSVNLWYRGRSLPIVWTIWPANTPLEGDRFWKRIDMLLDQVAQIVPQRVPVIMLADRAFGTPAFTDLVSQHGWHWVVRVQDQTVYQDRQGRTGSVRSLVRFCGQRKKLRGQAFKKAGWRALSVVVYWGHRHQRPLCLVSDLHPDWSLVALYRQRFPIEGTFRDYKRYGWGWEQSQVKIQAHMERLLVGMALATWITFLMGSWKAYQFLHQLPTGHRHTRPWEAKQSLFHLGLEALQEWFQRQDPLLLCLNRLQLDWATMNWSTQITSLHARAFVFSAQL